MTKQKIIFWVIILVITFFTRFYRLSEFPPHLTIDEVSIGYNAFSILKTGKDEWGIPFPVSFRSVGDYKAPVLIYLTIPFVWFLGLNELSVRLPVAIFSVVNIFLVWYLTRRHIFDQKYSHLSYLTTVIFSISPWLVVFSRSGFEAIIALTFLLSNLIFLFEFRRSGYLIHFFFMFVFAYLSAVSYHSTKIVVPLLNIFFILTNFRFLLSHITEWYTRNKFVFLFTTLILVSVTVFFVQNFILGPGSSRAGMTFLSKDYDFTHGLLPKFSAHPLSSLTSSIGLAGLWFKRYLEYFSANFYLSSGLGLATPGHPGQGVIFAIEYLFLIVGFFVLLFGRRFFASSVSRHFVITILTGWFFFSLLPASITNNSQHALRTLNIVPVISILIALGLIGCYEYCRSKLAKSLLVSFVILGYLFGLVRFVDFYTLHYPVELSETRSYGWKQMALFARDHHGEYDKVYVDPQFGTQGPYTYGVPYLYFLFYSRYDPNIYNSDPRRKLGGSDFENYLFTHINWPDLDHSQNNLYIASQWSLPKEVIGSSQQKYFVPFLNQSSGLYAVSDR
ncbi:TPA: hypothetical protein DIU27_00780 [Candidatus Collierbacteria bacterium]|uniref:Glycosyltransferase RgtA/B/C/D-like domain-containing protein n=1 Tax=Candidatus Collierbacteria bacterium GW2011_GWB2_44_22 TaxID=1618387 RepID=A0A0G1HZ76_9BACT|nr:MAG: hypothetical protein UW31_C0005G0013 [Candidatus Collierbacteria bacterium GW2011_GWA2_44_13]KKT49984.1 MAG: hypothetical protein UW42_C0027G0003 [Candidatus Collierbacteria bacterium GW2011_GWB1_44_197]KKT52461.1 MAG: hypothetical protein UW44_C0001G0013 [Candidatus Collierbacteria bacterium GW2011_GWB2_44_22]KKT61724.1 MAG: hypothetical protein UW56_C0020G0013 [Candidatus Collierbacteria bacterium GW2011_GWD1_44_27]KKT65531.1 MAG: hypothetical protein UW58_C0027G0013 [Candidatus Colli